VLSPGRLESPGNRVILGTAGGAFVGVVNENPILSILGNGIRKGKAYLEGSGGFRLGLGDVGRGLGRLNSKGPVTTKEFISRQPNGSLCAGRKIPKHRSVVRCISNEKLRGSFGKTDKAVPGILELGSGTGRPK